QKQISELDFYIRSSEPGEYIDGIEAHILEHALSISEVKKKSRPVEQRKLLVSDSPENITESGILYEDTINGKARLYANHVNAGAQPIKLAILATNETDESITIFTSRQGQSMPSKLALLVGSEAALDFISEAEERSGVDSTDDSKLLLIAPGETIIYRQLPTLAPQYGLNALHDVQSSGELKITFVA